MHRPGPRSLASALAECCLTGDVARHRPADPGDPARRLGEELPENKTDKVRPPPHLVLFSGNTLTIVFRGKK